MKTVRITVEGGVIQSVETADGVEVVVITHDESHNTSEVSYLPDGWPKVGELAAALASHIPDIDTEISGFGAGDETPGFDVRLQVHDGSWSLHTGDASYDQDHRGYWGAGFLTEGDGDCRELAQDLIDEALLEMEARSAEG